MPTDPPATPAGGPIPPELAGEWFKGDVYRVKFEDNRVSLINLQSGGVGGSQVVVDGDELVLFNSVLCGLTLPDGIGRYRWTLDGDELHLEEIGRDPCTGRRSPLAGATLTRDAP
jgi:hypothetical protein